MINLQPLDILVNVNTGNDLWHKITRWATGEYSHVFMYMGKINFINNQTPKNKQILTPFWYENAPMIYESNARGVCLRHLISRMDQDVVVMRLKKEYYTPSLVKNVITEAIKIFSNEASKYDYPAILTQVFFRVLIDKLKLPIPKKWNIDKKQICSEAVLEAFRTTNIKVLNEDVGIPLPVDYVLDTQVLEEVYRGKLSFEILNNIKF